MGEVKSRNIFSVIKNNWWPNPSTATWVEENSYQPKEHSEAYQSTYANFVVQSSPTQQILPDSSEGRELTEKAEEGIFFKYCSEATIHGVRHLCFTTNKIRRFLYVIIVVLLTGFLLNLLIGILISYSTNPYKTNYYAKVMKEMDFPTVTICNIERMVTNTSNYQRNSTLISIFEDNIPRSITIEKCLFNEEPCNDTKPTVMIIRKRMHGCYTIEPSANRTFDMEGLEANEGLFVDLTTNRSLQIGEKGVQVFLHQYKTDPDELGSSFFAGPKDATFAVIQPEKVIKLGVPYHDSNQDCRDNESPNFKNPLKYYDMYSMTNCQRECTSRFIGEYCNCTLPFFPGEARPCIFEDYECLTENMAASKSQNNYINRCKCTPNCSYLHYESRISVTRMRYGNHSKEDMFRIRIYFDKMVMKFVKEKPRYELDDLLASFGGQMGLLLGASVISVFEFFEEDMFRIRIYFENMVMKFLKEKPRYELDDLLVFFGGQMGLFLGASVISVYEFLELVLLLLWSRLRSMFRKAEPPLKRTAAMRKKNTVA